MPIGVSQFNDKPAGDAVYEPENDDAFRLIVKLKIRCAIPHSGRVQPPIKNIIKRIIDTAVAGSVGSKYCGNPVATGYNE